MDQFVWTVWLCSWWAQTAHFLGVGMPLRCARALSLHAVARAWRPLRPRVAGGCRCPGAAPLVGEGAPTREAPFGCEGVILVSISAGGTRARCRDAACSTYEQQAAQRADPNQVLFLRVPHICPHCLSTPFPRAAIWTALHTVRSANRTGETHPRRGPLCSQLDRGPTAAPLQQHTPRSIPLAPQRNRPPHSMRSSIPQDGRRCHPTARRRGSATHSTPPHLPPPPAARPLLSEV
jgi:hypothetical protein